METQGSIWWFRSFPELQYGIRGHDVDLSLLSTMNFSNTRSSVYITCTFLCKDGSWSLFVVEYQTSIFFSSENNFSKCSLQLLCYFLIVIFQSQPKSFYIDVYFLIVKAGYCVFLTFYLQDSERPQWGGSCAQVQPKQAFHPFEAREKSCCRLSSLYSPALPSCIMKHKQGKRRGRGRSGRGTMAYEVASASRLSD